MERTGFLPEKLIIEAIRESNNYDPSEDLDHAGGFVLCEAVEWRTWLIATRLRLYCILDRRDPGGPRILWSISRSRLFERGRFCLEVRRRDRGGRPSVDIGYRKDTEYSPWLFEEMDIRERIKGLVLEKMRGKNLP